MQAKAKPYIQYGNVVYLEVRPHRKVRTTRLVWKPLNRLQAWLEGEDKPSTKVVAYVVLAVAGLYMLGQVVRVLL